MITAPAQNLLFSTSCLNLNLFLHRLCLTLLISHKAACVDAGHTQGSYQHSLVAPDDIQGWTVLTEG
jgi:hypothetical protein